MKDQSHKAEMRAALRADFERLRVRQERTSAPRARVDPPEPIPGPSDPPAYPQPDPVPPTTPEPQPPPVPSPQPEPSPMPEPPPTPDPPDVDPPGPNPIAETQRRSWLRSFLARD